jgi:hypothetical protein
MSSKPPGLEQSREEMKNACNSIGIDFPKELLDYYEQATTKKFAKHHKHWRKHGKLVLLTARWVGRISGEFAKTQGKTAVEQEHTERAFEIARDVCQAFQQDLDIHLAWCPDPPPTTMK